MSGFMGDGLPTVCVTHGRVTPCRVYKLDEPCVYSNAEEDVLRVLYPEVGAFGESV